MNRLSGLALLSAAPLLAYGLAAAAEEPKIYECTDSKGQVVYQDGPCIEPAPAKPEEAVKPQAPAETRHPAKTAAAKRPAATLKPTARQGSHPPEPPHRPRPLEPPPFGLPVDARWATPAKTLQTFVAAVKAGDRSLALSCLAGSALADLGPDPDEMPLEALRLTVDSFTGYVSEGDLGPFWSIRALRAGLRPKWIFFERAASGEWKIGGF